jgi:high-affinity iron transporter
MLAVAIIVFREVLEAALIVSIVMAASLGIAMRNQWIGAGVAGGVLGAGLVAMFAAAISAAFSGTGQEILNASILLFAAAMLAWHNIWMAGHGRVMARRAKDVGRQVAAGTRPLYTLSLICGFAVLREGAETVLFIFSIVASAREGVSALLLGGLIGLAGGVALVILYLGLLQIPASRLFTVTGWMILLLAAGLAAQGAGFLVQGKLLPPLGEQLWDTSSLLSEGSIAGRVLHTLIGYIARPSGVELLAYILTLLAIGISTRVVSYAGKASAGVAAIIVATLLCGPRPAWADLHVRMPTVEYREFEFEHNGLFTFDQKGSDLNGQQSYTNAIGYGVLPWWKVELEGELAGGQVWSGPGQPLRWRILFS